MRSPRKKRRLQSEQVEVQLQGRLTTGRTTGRRFGLHLMHQHWRRVFVRSTLFYSSFKIFHCGTNFRAASNLFRFLRPCRLFWIDYRRLRRGKKETCYINRSLRTWIASCFISCCKASCAVCRRHRLRGRTCGRSLSSLSTEQC